MQVIQLLPLNDSGQDPSPYNALSACALDPVYLGLKSLPYLEHEPALREQLHEFHPFTHSQRIDRVAVKEKKLLWLQHYVTRCRKRLQRHFALSAFMAHNPWLQEYALFIELKCERNGSSWEDWETELRDISLPAFQKLLIHYEEKLFFHYVLQFLSHQQLSAAKAYAEQKHVLLKGDIPILLSPDSSDVWIHRSLFDTSLAAGAPPDLYNTEGQYWGFPLYNWSAHHRTGFAWLARRLRFAQQFFHLYRIDHVVGLFRIWAIPKGGKASLGHFLPENIYLWPQQGKDVLQRMLAATDMLPIAEDLGIIPSYVFSILKELGICGTRILRWERWWDEDGEFIPLRHYQPFSVTALGTHDTEPLAHWWRTYAGAAQLFSQYKGWIYEPHLSYEHNYAILWDSHHTQSLFHINPLQEYLMLFPELSWDLPEDERINIPGTLHPRNWCYRFRRSLEEMVSHPKLHQAMRDLIS